MATSIDSDTALKSPDRGSLQPAKRDAHVWIISELYYPEETSTGYVATELAEGLADAHRVEVLCGQPTYSARGTRARWIEERNGVTIRRCAGCTFNKDHLPLRLLNMVTLSASMWFQMWRRIRRGDVVLVFTNPPVLPFLVAAVCKLRRTPSVLVIHDVYPEALTAAGLLSKDGTAAALVDRLNRWLYSSVDRVTVLGRDMRRLVLRKLGVADDPRVSIIPNWADPLSPQRREDNRLLSELGLAGKFVVLYAGNMGAVHDIEVLFETARRLSGTAPAIHFLFVGSGARKAWLEEAVRRAQLTNVTVTGNRPRQDQESFLNACDVTVFAFRPGMTGAGVPSRMYNIMAVGRPMIAAVDEQSEQARMIREEGIGWVTPVGGADQLVAAVLEASSNADRLLEMGRRARLAAQLRYTRAHSIAAYGRLVSELLPEIE